MKTTQYFRYACQRSDRVIIQEEWQEEWIERAIKSPLREEFQSDSRIRR